MSTVIKASELLLSYDKVLVISHASPDGDTLGSASALIKGLNFLGKKTAFLCADPIGKKFSYLFEDLNLTEYDESFHVVTVDIADPKLMGKLCDEYKDKVELSIDHHATHVPFGKHEWVNPHAASNCEMIFELLSEMNVLMDKSTATKLYTGVATDTGCFKFTNTTANTHIVAAQLIEKGADYGTINRIMFDTKSRARIEVEKIALESIQYYLDNRCAVLTVTKQMQDMTTPDELEGITALTKQIEGVEIGVTLRYKGENRYKISVRTIEPIDASSICARLGGGGHIRAAGCEVNLPVDEAKKVILESVKKELGI